MVPEKCSKHKDMVLRRGKTAGKYCPKCCSKTASKRTGHEQMQTQRTKFGHNGKNKWSEGGEWRGKTRPAKKRRGRK